MAGLTRVKFFSQKLVNVEQKRISIDTAESTALLIRNVVRLPWLA